MNNASSSYFIANYDRLLYFWGRNGLLWKCCQNKYIFIAVGMWEGRPMVKHSTADREVGGSIPLAPFFIITVTFRRTFDVWKINLAYYFEQRRNMNLTFSSYFIAIYDRLLHFRGRNGVLGNCSQNQVYLLRFGHWERSSVVEHSTADREVGGSIPLAPFFIIVGYLSKEFRCLKD